MSGRLVVWAMSHAPLPVGNSTEAHALVVLAWNAHDRHGGYAWLSAERLAREMRASERTAQRALRGLRARGLLVEITDPLARQITGKWKNQRPTVWRLATELVQRCDKGCELCAEAPPAVDNPGPEAQPVRQIDGAGPDNVTYPVRQIDGAGPVRMTPNKEVPSNQSSSSRAAAAHVTSTAASPDDAADTSAGAADHAASFLAEPVSQDTPRLSFSPPSRTPPVRQDDVPGSGPERPTNREKPSEAAAIAADALLVAIFAALPSAARSKLTSARLSLAPTAASVLRRGHDQAAVVAHVLDRWGSPHSPAALLTTLLRELAAIDPDQLPARDVTPTRKRLGCDDCTDGWLAEDDDGRPTPCPACRPHHSPKRRAG